MFFSGKGAVMFGKQSLMKLLKGGTRLKKCINKEKPANIDGRLNVAKVIAANSCEGFSVKNPANTIHHINVGYFGLDN